MKEITFRDVLDAKRSGDISLLSEVSLNRVYQHVKDSPDKGLTLMTAWRKEMSRKEKIAANKRLMQDIRSAGLGAFNLAGYYWECQDPNIDAEDCPQDKKERVRERVYGIVGATRQQTLKWIKRYKQDSAVYLGPETKGKAVLLFQSGKEMNIGEFNPGKIGDNFSKIHGSTFVFEGFEYLAQSIAERLIEDGMGVIFSTK
ncbi:hypothetical protein E2P64_07585 [Candidatus Bathyarchaeota archaeon]|nr:hypothetical protein E2P64_07585 [Candidatus Bathyarchaeota archaeon]